MPSRTFIACFVGLICSGCIGLIASGSSNHNATGKERKFILDQKAEAYWTNRKVLDVAEKETLCNAHKKPEFTVLLNRLRRANERVLLPEVSLAEANIWSDTFRDKVKGAQRTCEKPVEVERRPPPLVMDPFEPFVTRPDAGYEDASPPDGEAPTVGVQ